MTDIFFVCGLIAFAVSMYIVVLNKRKTEKILNTVSEMIDRAIGDTFAEDHFDETKLSQIENKLAQYLLLSKTAAQNINFEKEKIKELITDISHQTKTPVANIMLYSDLLQEENIPESCAVYLQCIKTQTQKLDFLIQSLIKISRLESGMIRLNVKRNNLMPMISRSANEYRKIAEAKNLALIVEKNDTAAIFDEKWTEEAIANIIDNAIKYTDRGSIRISIKDYEFFSCIEIQDTGIGIAEHDQAKIFSRFYRSEQVKNNEGAGVGLYLSRQIMHKQGGYIKVESASGCGSVFSVFIPKSAV